MSARLRLSSLAALAIAFSVSCFPAGCTSFGDDITPGTDGGEAGDSATTADSPFADSGKDDCRVECPGRCVTDPFDALASQWSRQVSSDNTALVQSGIFTSILVERGAAFLLRPLRILKDTDIQLSFVAVVDKIPANGTTLAKVVDDIGNELNVRVDEQQLHTCLERNGVPGASSCSDFAKKLVVGERIRVTFLAKLPTSSGVGSVSLRVDCDPRVELALPTLGGIRTDVDATLRIGLEGPGAGAARFDSADVLPPD